MFAALFLQCMRFLFFLNQNFVWESQLAKRSLLSPVTDLSIWKLEQRSWFYWWWHTRIPYLIIRVYLLRPMQSTWSVFEVVPVRWGTLGLKWSPYCLKMLLCCVTLEIWMRLIFFASIFLWNFRDIFKTKAVSQKTLENNKEFNRHTFWVKYKSQHGSVFFNSVGAWFFSILYSFGYIWRYVVNWGLSVCFIYADIFTIFDMATGRLIMVGRICSMIDMCTVLIAPADNSKEGRLERLWPVWWIKQARTL